MRFQMSKQITPTSTTAFDLKQDSGVKLLNSKPRKLSDEVHQNNEMIKTASCKMEAYPASNSARVSSS